MNNLEKTAKRFLDQSVIRKNLEEQAEQSLTLAHNNGLFKVTPELITFVESWARGGISTESESFGDLIIKDSYNNPIKIDDQQEFLLKLIQKYQEVMNDWHNEFQEAKKIRKPDQV